MPEKFHLLYEATPWAARCPYRLLDSARQEVAWANQFLDAQCLRGLALSSQRIYAFDLLNFARWWFRSPRRKLAGLKEQALLQYVRFQLAGPLKPAPATINHRLTVVRCLYRFHFGRDIAGGPASVRTLYTTRCPLGYGKRRQAAAGLRVKQPRRVIVPLTPEQVAQFWQGFRTYRDLALIALMLFDGLRSVELLRLQLLHVDLSQAQLRIFGKGHKERILPLSDDVLGTLQNYLHLERPFSSSPVLFVSLKGKKRGQPMTAAGLRSLFRHHRRRSHVTHANPHRFRHTFGSDMVAAGLSLPALMHLMGHAHIETTMLYVQLSPQEVWRQYHLAVAQRTRLSPAPNSSP